MHQKSTSPGSTAVERARRYLATLPPAFAGERGHDATFRAACALVHGFGLNESTAYALLAEWNNRCLPPWSPAELTHKVQSAVATPSARPNGYLLTGTAKPVSLRKLPPEVNRPEWPKPDPARIVAAVKDGPGAVALSLLSPAALNVDEDGTDCAPLVRALFATADAPDPLLCIGKSARRFATRPLSQWLAGGRLAEFALIVPARMTARHGQTKDGRESEHTLTNTGPRRFVVVEFDTGTADEHAARLWHLSGFAPLALIVHSGGKSLHGWFPVGDGLPDDVRRFMRYAARIGADPALFRNRSQFCRQPAGTRENGCRQSVFYWNPAALASGTDAALANGGEAA